MSSSPEDQKAIDDLREHEESSLTLLIGPETPPQWKRTQQTLGCYAGLKLDPPPGLATAN